MQANIEYIQMVIIL